MRIFIEPMEPLLFRTGRPFNAGENNFAETIFPPTPETLQGALRAMIAIHWGKSRPQPMSNLNAIFNEPDVTQLIGRRVSDRNGYKNIYGRFRITGLSLGRRKKDTRQIERLFPAPAHLIRATLAQEETEKTITKLVQLEPVHEAVQEGRSNHPAGKKLLLPVLGGQKTGGKSEPLEGWLTESGLYSALKGGIPDEGKKEIVPNHEIYIRESRLGIGMNNATQTSEEGLLYQVQMIRMQENYGFVVDIQLGEVQYGASELPQAEQFTNGLETPSDLAFLQEGWLTLGGEQRAARFEVLKPEQITAENGLARNSTGKMLYFATPAYFVDGWLPANAGILPADPSTAAINRYQTIGGWYLNTNDAGGSGKMARRCVPAGSVYFFDTAISVTQPVTEYGWQIGYGITYIGGDQG
jgi:CRISPR-associated protein Cmr3